MKRFFKHICSLSSSLLLLLIQLPPVNISASEQSVDVALKYYEFEKNSNYPIDATLPSTLIEHAALGALSVHGDIIKSYQKDGIPAYEIADGKVISIKFAYDKTLLNAPDTEWHLYDDNNKEVNGISLGERIDCGAVIFQTSFDGIKWATANAETNVRGDIAYAQDNFMNDIQLVNGCYYRVIVAYKTEIQRNPSNLKFAIWNTPVKIPNHDYQKNAEVYEFYASYKESNSVENTTQKHYFTTLDYTTSTDKNNYVGSKDISSKDPHYGWSLGAFCISGYTAIGDTNDVYLKSVGNKVKLTFNLEQDIYKLNGNSDLQILSDKDGSDGIFQTKPHNMKHGELLVKHTDSEGISTITAYSDFLESLAFPGVDTTIQLYEEGDYEVHLNYAIVDKDGLNTYTYYRMSFQFKVRNSNCMVYLFDCRTGSELGNGDVTENGFRIDSAKSSYPKLSIKKEILNNTQSGLTEDTRFNRSVADGEVFSDEGIYTITSSNRFDEKLEPVIKTIYVGTNNILTAYTKHLNTGTQYTIAELNHFVSEGYTITDQGELMAPFNEITATTVITTTIETTTTPVTTSSIGTEPQATEIPDKPNTKNKIYIALSIGAGGLALLTILISCIRTNIIKKKSAKRSDAS